jgi:hypothetical protein
VRLSQVRAVARWLDSLGISYVVVGGSAIERIAEVGTKDVAVLIAISDWGPIDRLLEHRREAPPLEPMYGTIRGTIVQLGSERFDVEFLSGEPFAGNRSGDDFLAYVRKHRSITDDGVRFANPDVVWYMRLSTDVWEQYVQKIRLDIRGGLSIDILSAVVDIGDHFGVGERMRERTKFVRETLDLYRGPSKSEKRSR